MSIEVEGQGAPQPSEGVASLSGIASMMGEDAGTEDALDESGDGDETEESEGEEIEAEEAGEADDEQQEEPTVTLKHDGKEFTLKQSEVVELAQKGYDYTQKTMQLADDRKAVEAARGQADALRQQHDQAVSEQLARLQALDQYMVQSIGSPPPVELAAQDVARYISEKEQYEHRKGQLEQVRAAWSQLQQEQARQRQAWIAQQGEETERALRDTLPGWNDKTLPELIDYAGKFGLGEKVADSVLLQKGFWELAHKAKAFDALMEEKAKLKPASQLPKVTPPAARNQPQQLARRHEALKRHKSAPSIGTLADLI